MINAYIRINYRGVSAVFKVDASHLKEDFNTIYVSKSAIEKGFIENAIKNGYQEDDSKAAAKRCKFKGGLYDLSTGLLIGYCRKKDVHEAYNNIKDKVLTFRLRDNYANLITELMKGVINEYGEQAWLEN